MKKLLSLLSVLTISSSAIPTTIAASPYQKENNNNNLKETMELDSNNQKEKNNKITSSHKNTMKLKIKRNIFPKWNNYIPTYDENTNIAINVPNVRQTTNLSCGPAIASSILRYWNFNLSEERLIRIMGTTNIFLGLGGGTYPIDWTNAMNNIITNNNLNNNRRYINRRLNPSIYFNELPISERRNITEAIIDYSQINYSISFTNSVFNSINNNAPVAFGFTGRFNEYENTRNHFILIYGITTNTDHDYITFHYMDPADGTRRSFRNTQLNSLLSNGGILIFHDPNPGSNTDLNPIEPMELGNCNYLTENIEHFCEINLSFNKINRFTRQINNNECPVINKYNPFFQENDVFEVDYQFLSHDKIKLKISLKTALGIEKMFFENNENEFKEYLFELFKKMPKNDNTGLGGSINNNDYDVMKNFVFDNYAYFHNTINVLQNNNNKYDFILIDINRGTEGLEPEAIKLI